MVFGLITYTSQFCKLSHGTKALQKFRKFISQERRIFISQERLIWFLRKWLLRTFAKNCKICSQVTSQSQIINLPTLKVSNPDSVGRSCSLTKLFFYHFFRKFIILGFFMVRSTRPPNKEVEPRWIRTRNRGSAMVNHSIKSSKNFGHSSRFSLKM